MVQINTENHFSLQGIDSLLEGVGVADEVTHHLGYGPLGRGRGGGALWRCHFKTKVCMSVKMVFNRQYSN